MSASIKKQVNNYINNSYGYNDTITLPTLYSEFPKVRKETIREIMRRAYNEGKLLKVKNGVYQLPNPNRVLKKAHPSLENTIDKLYLFENNNRVGYLSGINFSNKIGLTTQTASVETIYSNKVSNKKREILIDLRRYIIDKARYQVTNKNYKILQILDLLTEFNNYSEYDLNSATSKIFSYLNDVKLNYLDVEQIVSSYPLETQVLFYKIGAQNVITQK